MIYIHKSGIVWNFIYVFKSVCVGLCGFCANLHVGIVWLAFGPLINGKQSTVLILDEWAMQRGVILPIFFSHIQHIDIFIANRSFHSFGF